MNGWAFPIRTSSNPGDVVLDPFFVCGTTIDAAEKLGRQWIGIDITALAISLIKNRLLDTYGSRLKFVTATGAPDASSRGRQSAPSSAAEENQCRLTSAATPAPERGHPARFAPAELQDAPNGTRSAAQEAQSGQDVHAPEDTHLVRIIGEPTTPNEAATLAEQDKFQFQWWALGLVGARPVEQKKGADHGIDGKVFFRDDPRAARLDQVIIQVKAGKAGVDHVRDLRGVLDRERAAMGVLITLQPPTKPMEVETASLGFYEHKLNGQKFPRLQIRTVRELMDGQGIERPTSAAAVDETFRRAPKAKARGHRQHELGIG